MKYVRFVYTGDVQKINKKKVTDGQFSKQWVFNGLLDGWWSANGLDRQMLFVVVKCRKFGDWCQNYLNLFSSLLNICMQDVERVKLKSNERNPIYVEGQLGLEQHEIYILASIRFRLQIGYAIVCETTKLCCKRSSCCMCIENETPCTVPNKLSRFTFRTAHNYALNRTK